MKIERRVLGAGLASAVLGMLLPAVSAAVTQQSATEVSTTVFERKLSTENLGAHFDVDRDLGRAWIDVVLTDDYAEIAAPEVVRRPLEGLYYDTAKKQVIYRKGANGIVCAEDSTFLGIKSLKDTGQCQLRLSSEKRKVDDGARVEEETVGTVVFEARKPNG